MKNSQYKDILHSPEVNHSDLEFLIKQAEKLVVTCRNVTERLLDDCEDVKDAVQRLLKDWRIAREANTGTNSAIPILRFLEKSSYHRQSLMEDVTPLTVKKKNRLSSSLNLLWSNAVKNLQNASDSYHNMKVLNRIVSHLEKTQSPPASLFHPAGPAAKMYGSDFSLLFSNLEKNLAEIFEEALGACAAVRKLEAFWEPADKATRLKLRQSYSSFAERRSEKEKDIPAPSLQYVPGSEHLWQRIFMRHQECYKEAMMLENSIKKLDKTAGDGLAASRKLLQKVDTLHGNAGSTEWMKAKRRNMAMDERIKELKSRLDGARVEKNDI